MQSIYKGVLMVSNSIPSRRVNSARLFGQVVGSRFPWATRNVHINALNDSTYVGMSLYNVVLLSITTAVVGYFLHDQHERSYILTSIFILLCVTITLCLVFVPKVLEVAKDPRSRAKPQRAMLVRATSTAKPCNSHDPAKHTTMTQLKSLASQNDALRSNATKVRIAR
mgnify:CR=1 FL=1